MGVDYVIVGAGISGCVTANLLHKKYPGSQILVVEKRDHIGGNCYDYTDRLGLLCHKYGPHLFHTNDKEVWDYVSSYAEGWYYYQHKVLSYVDGQYVPFPPDEETVARNWYGSDDSYKSFVQFKANSLTFIRSRVGKVLYKKMFAGYTRKQWGKEAEELSYEVCGRIPVRNTGDTRYFDDQYQGVPLDGYTEVLRKVLCSSSNIHVLLNTPYQNIDKDIGNGSTLIWTGPVDEYFNYVEGRLPYRSLRFENILYWEDRHQLAAIVNYPNNYDYTRSIELKHITKIPVPYTNVVYEYPVAMNQLNTPYYPIPCKESDAIFGEYQQRMDFLSGEKVYFLGRLGRYQYINMDVAVREAMDLVKAV